MPTKTAQTTPAAIPAAEAQEFRTGRVHSETRHYDLGMGQQVAAGTEEYVTFHDAVDDADAVEMLDDPKAVRAYMEIVGAGGFTLASKPFRLVGGAAVASRYKAKKAFQSTR